MKLLRLGMALLLLFSLTGCWSKLELDELTFIFGMYVDAGTEPGTVELTISTPLPNRLVSGTQGGTAQGKSYSTVTKTAHSITDAIIMIQKDLSRRLEISHIKAIVVGQEYAANGIHELLEWCKRQPEIPQGTYIMAAPGKASEVARLSAVYEQLPDQVLRNISELNLTYATTIRVYLLAEANNMGYAMNYLSFGVKPDEKEQGEPVKWAGVQGVMLFKGMKMTGTLNSDESRALSWAAGDLSGHLTLPMYTVVWNEQDSKGKASALFYSDTVSRKVQMTADGPVFHVRLKGKASITLFDDNNTDEAVDHNSLIQSKLEEKIKSEVKKALDHTQEAGTDVLQLGMLLEWNHPKEWKKLKERWSDYYADRARIVVKTDISIVDFGASK
ncbi:Spore germination protein B3 precursor [compost metagenome]